MTNAELGHIIKEARIARRMTQSEVVGDFITRNMLSQIENGNAAPSMRTLQYLMKVLDIHINIDEMPGYSQDATADSESSASTGDNPDSSGEISDEVRQAGFYRRLMQYKKYFAEGRYDTICTSIDSDMHEQQNIFLDEYCALGARSCYEYARQLASNGNAHDAVQYADKAADYAGKGIYSNNDILAKAILLSHEQALRLS